MKGGQQQIHLYYNTALCGYEEYLVFTDRFMKVLCAHINPSNVGSCNLPFIQSRCGVYGPSHDGFGTGEVAIEAC